MLKHLLTVFVICFPFVVYSVSVKMGIVPVSMFVYSKCVSIWYQPGDQIQGQRCRSYSYGIYGAKGDFLSRKSPTVYKY